MPKNNQRKTSAIKKNISKKNISKKNISKNSVNKNSKKMFKGMTIDSCLGRVNMYGELLIDKFRSNIPLEHQETVDLLCMIMYDKPIAHINYFKGNSNKTVDSIYELANKQGFRMFINDFNKNNITLTIFNPKNLQSKKAALLIYFNEVKHNKVYNSKTYGNSKSVGLSFYDIGKLLGYPDYNIKGFYKRINKEDNFIKHRKNHLSNINNILNSSQFQDFKHIVVSFPVKQL